MGEGQLELAYLDDFDMVGELSGDKRATGAIRVGPFLAYQVNADGLRLTSGRAGRDPTLRVKPRWSSGRASRFSPRATWYVAASLSSQSTSLLTFSVGRSASTAASAWGSTACHRDQTAGFSHTP